MYQAMRNRRGQLPMLMLVLVAIVLVVTTLFIFASFGDNVSGGSILVSKMLNGVEFGHDYVVGSAKIIAMESIAEGSDFKENVAKRDIGVIEGGNFFGQIRNDNFTFNGVGGDYLLRVDGLFVRSVYGNNEMRRDFDLCLLFDSQGNYIPEILKPEGYKGC